MILVRTSNTFTSFGIAVELNLCWFIERLGFLGGEDVCSVRDFFDEDGWLGPGELRARFPVDDLEGPVCGPAG